MHGDSPFSIGEIIVVILYTLICPPGGRIWPKGGDRSANGEAGQREERPEEDHSEEREGQQDLSNGSGAGQHQSLHNGRDRAGGCQTQP